MRDLDPFRQESSSRGGRGWEPLAPDPGFVALVALTALQEGSTTPLWIRLGVPALIGVGLVAAAFFALTAYLNLRARQGPVQTGIESLVGKTGVARTPLSPDGVVFLDGELWQARAVGQHVSANARVSVRAVEGLMLVVAPLSETTDTRRR